MSKNNKSNQFGLLNKSEPVMEQTQTITKQTGTIHPAARIDSISLTVQNLQNQIHFYQQVLGFTLHWRDGDQAGLGTETQEILHLVEQPNARRYHRVTGLYHFAILFPNRRELARAVARLFTLKYPNSPTDHILTKTTYLSDPEGNQIELYAESPEDGEWFMEGGVYGARRADGTPSDGREPLDLEDLFSHLTDSDRLDIPLPPETRIGHVHLYIRNIEEAVDFYHGVLGFDLMGQAKTMRMAFVSAGGYHHHIGLNTWQGEGASPPPLDSLGMRYFSIALPNQSALDEVIARVNAAHIPYQKTGEGFLLHDPSRNGILLKTS